MVNGYIFDLDGTIYLDNQLIDGAAEAIRCLRERGDKIVFLTNKSISTRYDYLTKLNNLGIGANIQEIINSNYITAKYLKQRMSKTDAVFIIGEEALFEEIADENITITDDPKKANYVILGWDRMFNYEKINSAYQAWVHNQATFVATNPDRTCPVYGGQIPDCAAMIGALEGVTGQSIDLIMGKPSKFAANFVVNEVLKMDPSKCFMVGDRLETDIRMGNENGLNSVLVLTGITTLDMIKESEYKPTYTLESIKDIVDMKNMISSG
ncbi:haloacid dehalogenase [Heyndrickxia sporothermodurans]|nr:haloacid dehalogenase [Heyndrickxia sporothermodurans]